MSGRRGAGRRLPVKRPTTDCTSKKYHVLFLYQRCLNFVSLVCDTNKWRSQEGRNRLWNHRKLKKNKTKRTGTDDDQSFRPWFHSLRSLVGVRFWRNMRRYVAILSIKGATVTSLQGVDRQTRSQWRRRCRCQSANRRAHETANERMPSETSGDSIDQGSRNSSIFSSISEALLKK